MLPARSKSGGFALRPSQELIRSNLHTIFSIFDLKTFAILRVSRARLLIPKFLIRPESCIAGWVVKWWHVVSFGRLH